MQIVLNSKFSNHLSVENLGETTKNLGYDGLDICLRPNHPIDPNNALTELPSATRIWEQQGLIYPLATAPADLNQPDDRAERLFAACAESGIPRLKIGFWRFKPNDDYWQLFDRARKALDGFTALSRRYQVQACYQTHSGPCLGSNISGLMYLLKEFDPQEVGAYPDLGHLELDGEDWPMGLSMMGNYLTVVGIKDVCYSQRLENSSSICPPSFVKVGAGIVDLENRLADLHKSNFNGPLTVHTEYQFDETIIRQVGYADTSPPNLEKWAKEDIQYLRKILPIL